MKLAASVSNFVPAPEGTTQAVLCDIVDLGFQEDKFNPGKTVHKMRFVFQTEDKTEEGVPFTVSTFPYTASLNSKANAYKIIRTLLGRDLEEADYDSEGEVDLDTLLLGQNAMVRIEHAEKDGKTYANVKEVSSVPNKIKDRLEVQDYVRVQDRTDGTDFDPVKLEAEAEAEKASTAKAGGKKSGDSPF